MPCSQTPVVSSPHRRWLTRIAAFRPLQSVGFPQRLTPQGYPAVHDYTNFGAQYTACLLVSPGSVPWITPGARRVPYQPAGGLWPGGTSSRAVSIGHPLGDAIQFHLHTLYKVPRVPGIWAFLGTSSDLLCRDFGVSVGIHATVFLVLRVKGPQRV